MGEVYSCSIFGFIEIYNKLDMVKTTTYAIGPHILYLYALLASSCSGGSPDKIERANAVLQSQLANDTTVEVNQASQKLFEPPGVLYYVCGTGVVNQPGITDRATQRYIINMNLGAGLGIAMFDGQTSVDGKLKFQKDWDRKCK